MIRLRGLKAMLGAGLLLSMSGAALASGYGTPPPPQPVGDDVVLCCGSYSIPTAPPTTSDISSVFIFQECNAIDPGAYAFNKCNGLVINCAETPAACSPNQDGTKDCICGVNLNLDVLFGTSTTAATAGLKK